MLVSMQGRTMELLLLLLALPLSLPLWDWASATACTCGGTVGASQPRPSHLQVGEGAPGSRDTAGHARTRLPAAS